MSAEHPAPARFIVGIVLCCISLALLGSDVIWALMAQNDVNRDGYAMGAVLLSTLAVAFLIGGGALLAIHLIRKDVASAREAHAAGRIEAREALAAALTAIETQGQALRTEIRGQARAGSTMLQRIEDIQVVMAQEIQALREHGLLSAERLREMEERFDDKIVKVLVEGLHGQATVYQLPTRQRN